MPKNKWVTGFITIFLLHKLDCLTTCLQFDNVHAGFSVWAGHGTWRMTCSSSSFLQSSLSCSIGKFCHSSSVKSIVCCRCLEEPTVKHSFAVFWVTLRSLSFLWSWTAPDRLDPPKSSAQPKKGFSCFDNMTEMILTHWSRRLHPSMDGLARPLLCYTSPPSLKCFPRPLCYPTTNVTPPPPWW